MPRDSCNILSSLETLVEGQTSFSTRSKACSIKSYRPVCFTLFNRRCLKLVLGEISTFEGLKFIFASETGLNFNLNQRNIIFSS